MRLILVLALAVLELVVIGGCEHKDKGGKDTGDRAGSGDPRLEGTYTFVGTEMNGTLVGESQKDRMYAISGNRMILPKGKKEEGITIQCDPNKNPCEIDLSRTEASGKVDKYYGIYKLEDDTLTLCLIKSDNPSDRPREFKTKDTIAVIWILKKTK